jgi:hypothetical protein
MAARVRVSEPDLRALLSVVGGDRGDPPAEGLPPSMLADLAGLIRCDILAFPAWTAAGRSPGSTRASRSATVTTTSGCSGGTTGPASPAVTPTGPGTCAP